MQKSVIIQKKPLPEKLDLRIKYSSELKQKIRKDYSSGGITYRELGRIYRISEKSIAMIINPKKKEVAREEAKNFLLKHSQTEKYKNKNKERAKKHYHRKQSLFNKL